jgi:hypothetical protein
MASMVEMHVAEYISSNALAVRNAMEESPNYQYIPLEHQDEIRILVLEPDHGSVSIRCSLKHVRLSEHPVYEGVSYVWGDSSKPEMVTYDEHIIHITKSLHTALKFLRLKDHPRVLWANAICINQDCDTEKNKQVALMGSIYSQTLLTNMWLGEDENECRRTAFKHVRTLTKILSGTKFRRAEMRERLISGGHTSDKEFDNWVSTFLADQVVTPILGNQWFNRLWCLQEALISPRLILTFGMACLDGNLLRYFILHHACPLITTPSSKIDITPTERFFNIGTYAMGDREDLLILVKKTVPPTGYKCKDPRDQIYALLGMAHCPGFNADYTLDVDSTFKKFASWTISPEQPYELTILQFARGDSQCLCDVPSWSPCYDMDPPLATLLRNPSERDIDFNASGYRIGMSRNILVENSSTLGVKGLVVDAVDQIAFESSLLGGFHRGSREKIDMLIAFVGISVISLDDDKYKRFCTALSFGLRNEGSGTECLSESEHLQLIHESITLGHSENLDAHIALLWASRNFWVTAAQKFSWVPERAQRGDRIGILYGSEIPHIIRQQPSGAYKYIGECWIKGFMHGEVLQTPNFDWHDIRLI